MKFIKHLSLYTFISFFSAGINFFLMPYLSHFLSPTDYGIITLVNTFVTILIPLVGLVASGLIFVEYYKIKDKSEFSSLFSSIQFIPVLISVILLIVSIPFYSSLARFIELPGDKWYWIPLSIVLSVLSIFYETLLTYNVIEKKARQFAYFNIAKILIEVGLTIYFVSVLRLGWEGRLLSWLIASVLLALVAARYFHKQNLLTLRIRKVYILSAIGFGLPLILHNISKFVINQSDRLFIAKMDSLEEAGIYNVGYQVGMLMLLLVNAVGNYFQPFLYERLNNPTHEAKAQIVKMTYLIIGLLAVFLIMLTLGAPLFFKYLVNESYANANMYVFWVGLSYFFWGIYIVFTGYIFFFSKTRILGITAIVNVALNIILNFWLIGVYGPIGAAYATCISFFVVALIITYVAIKMVPMPWFNVKFSGREIFEG